MVKYYWIFGSIAGLSSGLLEYLLFSGIMGYEKSYGALLGKFLALFSCILFAIILIKKLNGSISFLRTSFSGLMIALICSAVSGICFSIMHYPDGHFFDDAKAYHIESWKKINADKPEELMKLDDQIELINNRFEMKTHTFFDLTGYVVAGLLFSALLAGFVADRSSLTG